jgi:tetratricopeptide (TPR) repeat protein
MSAEQISDTTDPRGSRTAWLRKVTGWLIGLAVLPSALLVLFEVILRVAGYGQCTAPFIRETVDGEVVYVRNKAFIDQFRTEPHNGDYWQREHAFALARDKAPGACRVFVFGSSAAMGWPDGQYSFSSLLNLMLDAAYPETRFEVYNCATGGMNSHVMREMASACAEFHPDAFVVYMGNNEFHGPFGVISEFRNNPSVLSGKVAHWLIRLNRTRLSQLMRAARAGWANHAPQPPVTGDRETVRPDSELAERASENFRENLAVLCGTAGRAGIPVFLSTLGANLRHWPPSNPVHLRSLSAEELERWERSYEEGQSKQQQGSYPEAMAAFRQAEAIEDTHAGLQFCLGECCWAAEDYDAARQHFTRAMDLDTFLWVRCKTRINDIICETARAGSESICLVDAAQRLSEESPHGVPGAELFPDSCHPNFKGNYIIARALFSQLAPRLPRWARGPADGIPEPISEEECARFLGFTPAEQLRVLRLLVDVIEGIGKKPNELLRQEMAGLEGQSVQETDEETLRICREAVARCPHHPAVRVRLVNQLMTAGLQDEAFEQARSFAAEAPYHRDSQRQLGHVLLGLRRYDAAAAQFDRALALYPDDVEALLDYMTLRVENGEAEQAIRLAREALLRAEAENWGAGAKDRVKRAEEDARARSLSVQGAELLEAGENTKALELFRRVQSMSGTQPAAEFGVGSTLESMGDLEGAAQAYWRTIELDPVGYPPYEALDRIYAANARLGDLESLWQEMVEKHPERHQAWFCLGLARERKDELEGAIAAYEESLRLSPENSGTSNALARALSDQGMKLCDAGENAKALDMFHRAQSLTGNLSAAEFGAGRALESMGDVDAAIPAYFRAIELDPAGYGPYEALDRIYAGEAKVGELEGLWREMTENHPDRHLAWFCLGLARERQDDLEGAIAAYEESLRLFPENSGTSNALARALSDQGAALLEAGEKAKALEIFRRAQSLSEALPAAEFGVGRALEAMGDVDGAIQAYLRTIEIEPAGYDPYQALDRIFAAQDKLGDLEGLWREMTEQHPGRRQAWFCLGLARERKDDLDGAIAAYEESLKIGPEASGTQQAIARALRAAGALLEQRGESAVAREYFRRAEAITPSVEPISAE